MRQRIVLVVSVLIGLLAFWLSRQYIAAKLADIEALRQQVFAGATMVWVVAAGRDMPAETVLQREDLAKKESLERDVGTKAIRLEDLDRILGKKLLFSLKKGETLLWSEVDIPWRPSRALAAQINPGMRAISISVGGAAAVSGLVRPNDRVDILGTFYFPSASDAGEMEAVTLTLLQDVTVLATGQTLAHQLTEADDRRRSASGYNTVTVEVSPREAELLVFAETIKGRLTLALRNPADVTYEQELPRINFERLEQELPQLNAIRQQEIRHKQRP